MVNIHSLKKLSIDLNIIYYCASCGMLTLITLLFRLHIFPMSWPTIPLIDLQLVALLRDVTSQHNSFEMKVCWGYYFYWWFTVELYESYSCSHSVPLDLDLIRFVILWTAYSERTACAVTGASVNNGCLSVWVNRIFAINIIMMWLRLMKNIRAFR